MPVRSKIVRSSLRRSDSGGGGGGGSGTVTSVTGSCRIAVTGTPTVTPNVDGGLIVACWTGIRYYALDFDGGDDAHAGFSDVSMAAAGAVAKKTWAALQAIIPPLGNGQDIVIAVKPRAAGALVNETITLSTIGSGYASRQLVATTDFSNNASDQITSGYVQGQVGPGTGGRWPVDAGATTTNIPISSGALSAEPALTGMRIRFDPATATAALRNVCRMIYFNDSTNITPETALPAVPANTDTFFVERPGVRYNVLQGCTSDDIGDGSVPGWAIRGIRAAGKFSGPTPVLLSGCEFSQLALSDLAQIRFAASFTPTGGSGSRIGASARCGTLIGDRVGLFIGGTLAATSGAAFTFTKFDNQALTHSYIGDAGLTIEHSDSYDIGSGQAINNANTPLRIDGGGAGLDMTNGNGQLSFNGVTIDNVTPNAAILPGPGLLTLKNVGERTPGSNLIGIDFSGAKSAQVQLDSDVAFADAVEIQMTADGAHTTFARTKTLTSCADDLGNIIWSIETSSACKRNVNFARRYINNDAGNMSPGQLVVLQGAVSDQIVLGKADTYLHAAGVVGVVIAGNSPSNTVLVADTGVLAILMTGAPTPGNICYMSAATAGAGVDTPPAMAATNQKLRHGFVAAAVAFGGGQYAMVPWQSEMIPITSDGVAP